MPGDCSNHVYACLVMLALSSIILPYEELIGTEVYLMHKWFIYVQIVDHQMMPQPSVWTKFCGISHWIS